MPDKTSPVSTSDTTSFLSLAGSEWGPESSEANAPEQFVQFSADNKVSGFGGCNRFFGTYTLDGQKLTIGPLASTKKMCRDVMDAEHDFLSALQAVKTIDFNGKSLKLKNEEEAVIRILQRRDWD